MAQLPSYVKVLLPGYGDEPDPDIIESKMSRGPSKTRMGNTKSLTTITATFLFVRREDSVAFKAWWKDTIKKSGWFDYKDPHTKTTKSVRFVGGAIGQAQAASGQFGIVQRTVSMEYYE